MAASASVLRVGLGQDAGLAVHHHFLDSRRPAPPPRAARRRRLGQHEALGLGLGGEEEQIRRLIAQGQRSRVAAHAGEVRPAAGLAARGGAAPRCPSPARPAAGGRGRGPAISGEGVEHALDALLPIEPPDVEADGGVGGQAEPRPRCRPGAGTEAREVDPGGDHRDRRPHAARAECHAMTLEGATTRSARAAKRQASRTAAPRPAARRQRHVVRVLLVARVVREHERATPSRRASRRAVTPSRNGCWAWTRSRPSARHGARGAASTGTGSAKPG